MTKRQPKGAPASKGGQFAPDMSGKNPPTVDTVAPATMVNPAAVDTVPTAASAYERLLTEKTARYEELLHNMFTALTPHTGEDTNANIIYGQADKARISLYCGTCDEMFHTYYGSTAECEILYANYSDWQTADTTHCRSDQRAIMETILAEHRLHTTNSTVTDGTTKETSHLTIHCGTCDTVVFAKLAATSDITLLNDEYRTLTAVTEVEETRAVRAALDVGLARMPEGWGPLPTPSDTEYDPWNATGPTKDLVIAMDGMDGNDGAYDTYTAAPIPMSARMVYAKDIARIDSCYVSYHGDKWTLQNNRVGSELHMVVLAELRDGRWLTVAAGTDYTGWGCQDHSDKRVANTREDAIRYGLTKEDRMLLGIEQGR